jgi:uncharacterized membrane protein YkvA (DUF1232 family)
MKTLLGLKVEQRLSTVLRRDICSYYESAVAELPYPATSEFNYIREKIELKHTALIEASSVWVREMALVYYAMYHFISCCERGSDSASINSEKALIAAIFYYVNPFDVIPDHTPGTGFLDDFYVAKCCIKKLSLSERKSLQLHVNRIR